MKLFNWFKHNINNNISVKETEKIYTESIAWKQECADKNIYKIKAKSKDEAFKKLVEYNYADIDKQKCLDKDIEIVTKTNGNTTYVIPTLTSVPLWFARVVNALGTEEDYKKLNHYLLDNGIKK